jgi:hypothetical protein
MMSHPSGAFLVNRASAEAIRTATMRSCFTVLASCYRCAGWIESLAYLRLRKLPGAAGTCRSESPADNAHSPTPCTPFRPEMSNPLDRMPPPALSQSTPNSEITREVGIRI